MFVLNPYFLTWASTILQVAVIVFSLALISFMISKNEKDIKNKDTIYWILVNLFCLSIAFQIGLISFACCIFIFSKYSIVKKGLIKEIALISLIFFISAFAWLGYKDKVLSETKNVQSGWNADYFSSASQLLLPRNLKSIPTAFDHSLTLTGIDQIGKRETESIGLVKSVYNGGDVCGVWFPTEFTYSANNIQSITKTTCSSSFLNAQFSKLVFVGSIFWQISNIFLWLSFAWIFFMFKSGKRFIVLPAYLLLISYSFLIFTIDRYILPTYIVGLFMFVTLINNLMQKFSKFGKVKLNL
jgi:hypothetical protein